MKKEMEIYNGLLQLHDNRTLWKIDNDINIEEYYLAVGYAIAEMENHFKNLEVYMEGRSGRHICVQDNPVNRRRYKHLVAYAEKLEQKIVDSFNNKGGELI